MDPAPARASLRPRTHAPARLPHRANAAARARSTPGPAFLLLPAQARPTAAQHALARAPRSSPPPCSRLPRAHQLSAAAVPARAAPPLRVHARARLAEPSLDDPSSAPARAYAHAHRAAEPRTAARRPPACEAVTSRTRTAPATSSQRSLRAVTACPRRHRAVCPSLTPAQRHRQPAHRVPSRLAAHAAIKDALCRSPAATDAPFSSTGIARL